VVWACEKVSPGCTNCYAEALSRRYPDRRAGDWNAGVMATLTPFLDEKVLRSMLTAKSTRGKRVFIGDMTDIFGTWVPDELLDRLFAVFAMRRDVTWQVLTKRADRLAKYMAKGRIDRVQAAGEAMKPSRPPEHWYYVSDWTGRLSKWPLPNVWLGVSAEDQPRADERIPLLLQTPAAVRFVSAEPLLGPIDLTAVKAPEQGDDDNYFLNTLSGGWFERETVFDPRHSVDGPDNFAMLDWVIAGGESNGRPCDVEWIRSLVRHCAAAGTAYFVKQLGSDVRDRNDAGFEGDQPDGWPMDTHAEDLHGGPRYQGDTVRIHLTSRKGGDPAEWPEDLRVRQFPAVPT
jgi:protein gp37